MKKQEKLIYVHTDLNELRKQIHELQAQGYTKKILGSNKESTTVQFTR